MIFNNIFMLNDMIKKLGRDTDPPIAGPIHRESLKQVPHIMPILLCYLSGRTMAGIAVDNDTGEFPLATSHPHSSTP